MPALIRPRAAQSAVPLICRALDALKLAGAAEGAIGHGRHAETGLVRAPGAESTDCFSRNTRTALILPGLAECAIGGCSLSGSCLIRSGKARRAVGIRCAALHARVRAGGAKRTVLHPAPALIRSKPAFGTVYLSSCSDRALIFSGPALCAVV